MVEDSHGRTIAFLEYAHRVTFQFGDASRSHGEDLVAHVRALQLLVSTIVQQFAPEGL